MKKTLTPRTTLAPAIAKVLKRLHYPLEVRLLCVRWYVAYSLSLRNLEEMLAERDIDVDHSTVHRWIIKLVPLFEKTFRKYKRPVRVVHFPLSVTASLPTARAHEIPRVRSSASRPPGFHLSRRPPDECRPHVDQVSQVGLVTDLSAGTQKGCSALMAGPVSRV
ncbi:hypothetical protein OKW37_000584 [Paraburkholderia sp. MM5482-R2]